MVLVIVAIIFIIRMIGAAPPAPAIGASAVAALSSSSAVAADASSMETASSSASSATANAAAESSTSSSVASPVAGGSTESASSAPGIDVVDARTMSQQSRRSLLLTLIQQGVFTGVEALGTPPKVGVTSLFQGLSPDLQQQFIAVVYAYINNGAAGSQTLELIDATSGSQVGSYSASDGLKLG